MASSTRNGSKRTPPYGPAKGMVQGLQLLRRTNPSQVDEEFLKANGVAPHNEYKVVGALRYLDLIDDDGRPTDKARLLKTRGAAYQLNLQRIVREAYVDLFGHLDVRTAGRDTIHNYFVTELNMGAEMAAKATRFFVELCRMAELEMGEPEKGSSRAAATSKPPVRSPEPPAPAAAPDVRWSVPMVSGGLAGPLTLALTPELLALSEDELAELFRKVLGAYRRALWT